MPRKLVDTDGFLVSHLFVCNGYLAKGDTKATCPRYCKRCLDPRKTHHRIHSGRVRSGKCNVEGVDASGTRSRSSHIDSRQSEIREWKVRLS